MNTQHSFVRRGLLVAGVTFLLAIVALARSAAYADELPRYKLKVGQELIYRNASADDEKKPTSPAAMRPERELTLSVVGQNDDGSWRILFRDRTAYGRNNDRKSAGWLDLAPDGRVTENNTVTAMANPFLALPALPANTADLAGGWSRATTADDTRRDYRAAAPPSGDAWKFEQDEHSPFELIYLVNVHADCEFDLAKGCLTRITTTSTQGWPERLGERGKVKGVFELAETRTLDAAQAAAIKDELTRYFALRAECEALVASDDLRHTAEVYAKALEKWQAVKDQFQQPIVREMYENQLDHLEKLKAYALGNAEHFGKFLDKPSADWQTTDLDDRPRALEDYRGKVVLLDFWYRGCGWCIRSMPQLKQLVDELPSDKFVILGMNNDRELADARFVIEKMGLNYDTLKNGENEEGIHAKYGVQGWPTLVILDGAGVVRHIHIGYSPRLREELGKKVRELLAEQGK